ncbi:MAG: glycosyltransferase family 4 protein [Actinobacteria bacterium]|nr:glycosyltransferase family 4 protein [Actinomycetota bacterium]
MTKKILVINQHFFPEVAATGQLLLDLCEDLVKAGYVVNVITGNPNGVLNKNNKVPGRENYEGIEILRLKNTTFNKYRMSGRILNYLTFHFLVFFQILFCKKPDLVFVLSTPPFISFYGLLLKVLKRVKTIYIVQDLFPDLVIELGKIKNKYFINILESLSKLIIRRMDRVVVVGEFMERKIKRDILQGMDSDHIIIIHNWADGEKIKVMSGEKEKNFLKEEWGLEGKFIVSYSGNIGDLHEFNTIISAANDLGEQGWGKICFVFIGEGIKKEYIERKVKEKGLNNVLFFPFQPREVLKYSLGLADVSLVTLEKGFEGMVVPSKIYGILASGRPAIAVVGGESEITEIIGKGKCGEIVKIGDFKKLSEVIINYYNNSKKCYQEGMSGRKYFEENYNRKIAVNKYIKVIEETLGSLS